jgi:hypothetical protein
LHSRAVGHIVWAVLIVKVKTIIIDTHQVKVFSLDGKLWFSKASDLKKFRQRLRREKRETQMQVRQYCPAHYLPVASPGDV